MNNKKRIVNLEYFREMLHICPRIPNQTFNELSFEEEILAFLRYLGYSGEIRKLTDVNINKLHQPWRSFAVIINKYLSGKSTGYDSLRLSQAQILWGNINKLHQPWRSFAVIINKYLSGKSTGYDSLRLSQAQILWGMYHKKNVDFAYLLWKDFVYQVEHKYAKKSNEMYYPMFTKVIIYFFMTKDPSIPKRNKSCLKLTLEGFPFITVNTKEYHSECSGNYHKDNA
nr:hypothetical protein [Tanacetum cinerariifolium]